MHLNPSNVHINPNGEKITGNHWHIYKKGFGKQFAYPATDIVDDDFVKNTIIFLQKFNVVKKTNIILQWMNLNIYEIKILFPIYTPPFNSLIS